MEEEDAKSKLANSSVEHCGGHEIPLTTRNRHQTFHNDEKVSPRCTSVTMKLKQSDTAKAGESQYPNFLQHAGHEITFENNTRTTHNKNNHDENASPRCNLLAMRLDQPATTIDGAPKYPHSLQANYETTSRNTTRMASYHREENTDNLSSSNVFSSSVMKLSKEDCVGEGTAEVVTSLEYNSREIASENCTIDNWTTKSIMASHDSLSLIRKSMSVVGKTDLIQGTEQTYPPEQFTSAQVVAFCCHLKSYQEKCGVVQSMRHIAISAQPLSPPRQNSAALDLAMLRHEGFQARNPWASNYKFPSYCKLPLELRIRIIKLSVLQPRVIVFESNMKCTPPHFTDPLGVHYRIPFELKMAPQPLGCQLNAEARLSVLKICEYVPKKVLLPRLPNSTAVRPMCLLSWSRETLFFSDYWRDFGHLQRRLGGRLQQWEVAKKVQNLCITIDFWKCSTSGLDAIEYLFPSLEEITILGRSKWSSLSRQDNVSLEITNVSAETAATMTDFLSREALQILYKENYMRLLRDERANRKGKEGKGKQVKRKSKMEKREKPTSWVSEIIEEINDRKARNSKKKIPDVKFGILAESAQTSPLETYVFEEDEEKEDDEATAMDLLENQILLDYAAGL